LKVTTRDTKRNKTGEVETWRTFLGQKKLVESRCGVVVAPFQQFICWSCCCCSCCCREVDWWLRGVTIYWRTDWRPHSKLQNSGWFAESSW